MKIRSILISIFLVGLAFTSIFTITRNIELSKELKATQENLENVKQQLDKQSQNMCGDSLTSWDMFTSQSK